MYIHCVRREGYFTYTDELIDLRVVNSQCNTIKWLISFANRHWLEWLVFFLGDKVFGISNSNWRTEKKHRFFYCANRKGACITTIAAMTKENARQLTEMSTAFVFQLKWIHALLILWRDMICGSCFGARRQERKRERASEAGARVLINLILYRIHARKLHSGRYYDVFRCR